MSSTSRVNKRARLARRAENDAMRTARRDSLAVLLSRAQRGAPLTVDEAALLRAAIEAEIREGDAARQAERGQQRAADRERERVTAAEAAIVEAEDERDRQHDRAEQAIRRAVEEYDRRQAAEAALDRVRALAADMRTWCSPHGIATQYADDIERALAEQPRAAVDVAPGVAVIRDRNAEQRAEQAEAVLAAVYDALSLAPGQLPDAAVSAIRGRAATIREQAQRADKAEQRLAEVIATTTEALDASHATIVRNLNRAEEAEQRLARIRDMVDGWKRRLPATIRTATAADAVRYAADGDDRPVMFAVTDAQAEAAAEQHRRNLADALGVSASTSWLRLLDVARTAAHLAQRAENTEAGDTAALNLAQSTINRWKARAQEAEEQTTTQLNRARMWRQKAIETDDRADRFEAAWKSARQRAAAQRTLADSRQERLSIRARRIIELETRAARAEQRTEWAERHVSSTARALARGDRYRAAWHSARDRARKANRRIADTRRYVEAAYSADMCDGVREDLRRLLDGQPPEYGAPWNTGPEVITDRATIRNTLAEEPTR